MKIINEYVILMYPCLVQVLPEPYNTDTVI